MTTGDRFTLEGKALSTAVTASGDLVIRGYAAVWEGIDREGENFSSGAFSRGVKAFLEGQAALCFHHKTSKVLGRVLQLKEDEKGLYMVARVDGAVRSHPELRTYYEQVKNGTLRGLSVGGFFRRNGRKITAVDLTEVSVTGVPIHSGTGFDVTEVKALRDEPTGVDAVLAGLDRLEARDALRGVRLEAAELRADIAAERLLRL